MNVVSYFHITVWGIKFIFFMIKLYILWWSNLVNDYTLFYTSNIFFVDSSF